MLRAIVRGAKGFAQEFRRELTALQIARATRAMKRRSAELEAMNEEQRAQHVADTAAILKRSAELLREKK